MSLDGVLHGDPLEASALEGIGWHWNATSHIARPQHPEDDICESSVLNSAKDKVEDTKPTSPSGPSKDHPKASANKTAEVSGAAGKREETCEAESAMESAIDEESEVAGDANEVAAGAKKVAGGAIEVTGGANEVAVGSNEVAAGAKEVTGGVKEVRGGAKEVAGGAENADDVAVAVWRRHAFSSQLQRMSVVAEVSGVGLAAEKGVPEV